MKLETRDSELVVIDVSSSSSTNVINLGRRCVGAFIDDGEESNPINKVDTNSGPVSLVRNGETGVVLTWKWGETIHLMKRRSG
uniref:Uncharacterized protein n=1 Tax=Tanacetum cinerariifolium TaxID=118510 RepID=A0A6L2MMS9_TANCI|nr:hypothetical protein [Tanacetum cinerariifolium]